MAITISINMAVTITDDNREGMKDE